MNQNWLFIRALVEELNSKIIGHKLVDAYSSSKEELVFAFQNPIEESFHYIKAHFLEGKMYLSFWEEVPNPGRRSLYWFSKLMDTKIEGIKAHGVDRSFSFGMTGGQTLFFKCYGRQSNLIHFGESGEVVEVFRTEHKLDGERILSDYKTSQPCVINLEVESSQEFYRANKFLQIPVYEELAEQHKDPEEFREKLLLLAKSWGVVETNLGYDLDLFSESFTSPMEVSNELVRKHFPKFLLQNGKQKLLAGKVKVLEGLKRKRNSLEKAVDKIASRKSNKEIADVLMANLHSIMKGETEVVLFDFYENKEVKIKLAPNLSPQANAERYYKKSKNEGKEVSNVKEKLEEVKRKITILEEEVGTIEGISEYKVLKKHLLPTNNVKATNKQESKPYYELVIGGLEIWLGKHAKGNDELLRLSSKNDWWLHAKDVSGSHCIVRNGGKELKPAELEAIAAVTAFYSKAKSQSLVPVIYTKRKYIRKPKGAYPGLVLVDREEVVLVEPMHPKNFN